MTEDVTESSIGSTTVSIQQSSTTDEIFTDLLTTIQATSKYYDDVLVFNCGFDSSLNFESQCGGIETKILPTTSIADIAILSDEKVSSSSPSLTLTDVKSISMFRG